MYRYGRFKDRNEGPAKIPMGNRRLQRLEKNGRRCQIQETGRVRGRDEDELIKIVGGDNNRKEEMQKGYSKLSLK